MRRCKELLGASTHCCWCQWIKLECYSFANLLIDLQCKKHPQWNRKKEKNMDLIFCTLCNQPENTNRWKTMKSSHLLAGSSIYWFTAEDMCTWRRNPAFVKHCKNWIWYFCSFFHRLQPRKTALEVIAIHVHLRTTNIQIVVIHVFWNGPNLTYSILIFFYCKTIWICWHGTNKCPSSSSANGLAF